MSFFCERCPHCQQLIEVVSEPQKVAFQVLCTEIDKFLEVPADSGHHIGPKKVKQLILLAYERDHDREAEILPAIDGDGWDVVFKRFSRLTKQEGSEVLAFAEAWASEHGVERKDIF